MKILYVPPSVEFATMGGALRHYHFLRALAQRHTITLLALTESDVPGKVREEISPFAHRAVIVGAKRDVGLPASRGWSPLASLRRRVHRTLRLREGIAQMRKRFQELAREDLHDVVLFNGEDLYPVVQGWDRLPLVADVCDATFMRLRQGLRYSAWFELPWRLFRYWEAKRHCRQLLKQTPHRIFITRRDRDAAGAAGICARVIPNGIALDYWRRQSPPPEFNRIVLSGVMSYPPNSDAAIYLIEKILPLLRRSLSHLEVIIVGPNPTPPLVEAARGHGDVVLTGYVEDVRPYLERASVFVAPLRYASGMQDKVLEAMAMEVPVVTTPVVAAGLRVDGEAEPPLRVGRRPGEIASHILDLLGDPGERSRLAAAGRRYVESHFDWSRSAAMVEEMCLEAVALHGHLKPCPTGHAGRSVLPTEDPPRQGMSAAWRQIP